MNDVAHTRIREATFLASLHLFNDVPPCIWSLICNKKLLVVSLQKKTKNNSQQYEEKSMINI